ncbi:retrotransposon protein, putative, ty1-copia subclass [Tanacetum coccineum]|uniref:Retrotransposon protein, putative, ty1-copia subclass n=1 Tax=Tanacetum coccineum TaxID=301880 RepID=A0ABQ5EAT4_9ASTR
MGCYNNGLKTTITARQSPTAFNELHALLSDHDYMLGKTRTPAPSITSSFTENYAVGSPSMPEARQAQLLELTAQLSALRFQVLPIAPSEAYYGDDALHVRNEWHQAIKEEYDALMKIGMWSLVPRASNTNVVDGKWVYKLKRDKNGAITRYKARFVAKGFRQQLGIDFHETFSSVVKSITIRAILSLVVTNNSPLRQLDIQNAFLHGNLKEQAPRAWFECLSKALFDLGFKGSKTDPSLFIYSCRDTLLYILVYVDDIIVTLLYILESSNGQIVDIFTKPLPTPRFLFLRSKLQVVAYP